MLHPCLTLALDEYESKTIEDLIYNQDHVIVKKSDNFYYSDKGSHSPTEVESYESLRNTPFITLLQQFEDLPPEYIIKLVRYYYKVPTLTSFGTAGFTYPVNPIHYTTGTYTIPSAPSTSAYYDVNNKLNVTDVPKF